jgi:hypothetical protein
MFLEGFDNGSGLLLKIVPSVRGHQQSRQTTKGAGDQSGKVYSLGGPILLQGSGPVDVEAKRTPPGPVRGPLGRRG